MPAGLQARCSSPPLRRVNCVLFLPGARFAYVPPSGGYLEVETRRSANEVEEDSSQYRTQPLLLNLTTRQGQRARPR